MKINVPDRTYRRLQEEARRTGKSPEALGQELLETCLESREQGHGESARAVLAAAGRIRQLGDKLREKVIPGVSLDEVRTSLTTAGGPMLSEIILKQRGPKD